MFEFTNITCKFDFIKCKYFKIPYIVKRYSQLSWHEDFK